MVLWFALLALAISIGRTLIDWGFVFPEFGLTDPLSVLGAMVLYVVIFSGWILAFCPTPCRTLWPVGEIWNWATTLSGVLATVVLIRALRARPV